MKSHPPTPRFPTAPDSLFESGHLWLFEWIDGEPFRFAVHEAGFLQFGDSNRVYDDADDLPPAYQAAVNYVQANLDREALRTAVDDVSSLVFFGQSTHQQTITYDWDRLAPFVGYDIWDGDHYLGPAATTQAFEKLGLASATTLEREVRARDFDPKALEMPDSAWYDGQAAGVLVRNKQGERTLYYDPPALAVKGQAGPPEERSITETIHSGPEEPIPQPSEEEQSEGIELAHRYADRSRVDRVVADLEQRGEPVIFDTVFERLLEMIARETHGYLDAADVSVTDTAFREGVAERTRELIDAGDYSAHD